MHMKTHNILPSCSGCQNRRRVEFDFAASGRRSE